MDGYLVIAIPIVTLGLAIYLYVRDKKVKDKVKNGRLTNEIIDFLKENDRYKRLRQFSVYPTSVSVLLDFKHDAINDKSFELAKKLTSWEMSCLVNSVCGAFSVEFDIKHFQISKGGSYREEIGVVGSTKIYGKREYTDGHDEHYIVTLKQQQPKKEFPKNGSNW